MKTRFTPNRAMVGATNSARMPENGRRERTIPMRVLGRPSSLRNNTNTGPNQVSAENTALLAEWA